MPLLLRNNPPVEAIPFMLKPSIGNWTGPTADRRITSVVAHFPRFFHIFHTFCVFVDNFHFFGFQSFSASATSSTSSCSFSFPCSSPTSFFFSFGVQPHLEKMSQGTLFGQSETRSILPVGLVKAFNLDVKLEARGSEAHKAAGFPNEKVPAFLGPHGYKLQEAIAVLYYCKYQEQQFVFFLLFPLAPLSHYSSRYFVQNLPFFSMMKKNYSFKQLSLS